MHTAKQLCIKMNVGVKSERKKQVISNKKQTLLIKGGSKVTCQIDIPASFSTGADVGAP